MKLDWPVILADFITLCPLDQIDFESVPLSDAPWDNLLEANWCVERISKYTPYLVRDKGLTTSTGRMIKTVDLPEDTEEVAYLFANCIPFKTTDQLWTFSDCQEFLPACSGAWGPWVYIPGSQWGPKLYYEKGFCQSIELNSIKTPQDILYELNYYHEVIGKDLNFLFSALAEIFGDLKYLPEKFDPRTYIKRFERCTLKINKRIPMPPKLRHQILERDGFRCCDCGVTAQTPGVVLEVDHKVAVSKGGSNDPDNLRTLCKDCNIGKSNRDIDYPEGHR